MAVFTTTNSFLDMETIAINLGDMIVGDVTPNGEPAATEIEIEIENSGGIVLTLFGSFTVNVELEQVSGEATGILVEDGSGELFEATGLLDVDVNTIFDAESGIEFFRAITEKKDVITGTELSDVISGFGARDIIRSDAGDDEVDGGKGRDKIRLGDGNDTADGGGGDDNIKGQLGNDNIVGGAGDDLLRGGGGDDFIEGNAGDDFVEGGSGADTLSGDKGKDRLKGGREDDEITGGANRDKMTGGAGNDVFIFNDVTDAETGKNGRDTITDFEQGDILDFNNFDFDPETEAFDQLQFADDFVDGTAGLLIVDGINIKIDLDGDANSDFQIRLSNGYEADLLDLSGVGTFFG